MCTCKKVSASDLNLYFALRRPGQRQHVTSHSSTPSIYLPSSDLYLHHLTSPETGSTPLPALIPLPPSIPSSYHPVAAVIPPLLHSLHPFTSVWQQPSAAESWKQREETGGGRRGAETALGLYNSVSSSIAIPSTLHLLLTRVLS